MLWVILSFKRIDNGALSLKYLKLFCFKALFCCCSLNFTHYIFQLLLCWLYCSLGLVSYQAWAFLHFWYRSSCILFIIDTSTLNNESNPLKSYPPNFLWLQSHLAVCVLVYTCMCMLYSILEVACCWRYYRNCPFYITLLHVPLPKFQLHQIQSALDHAAWFIAQVFAYNCIYARRATLASCCRVHCF